LIISGFDTFQVSTTIDTSHLDIKAIGSTKGGNARSFTILSEPNSNIKKAFKVRLWPAIKGEKGEDISVNNTLSNISFEINCVD